MYQMTQHAQTMRETFDLEADGLKADEPRNRAEWARMTAAEIKKQGMARKEVLQGSGEAVPPAAERFLLHNTLTVPDLVCAC